MVARYGNRWFKCKLNKVKCKLKPPKKTHTFLVWRQKRHQYLCTELDTKINKNRIHLSTLPLSIAARVTTKFFFLNYKTVLLRDRKWHTTHAPHLQVHLWVHFWFTSGLLLVSLPVQLLVHFQCHFQVHFPFGRGGVVTVIPGPGGGVTLVPGLRGILIPGLGWGGKGGAGYPNPRSGGYPSPRFGGHGGTLVPGLGMGRGYPSPRSDGGYPYPMSGGYPSSRFGGSVQFHVRVNPLWTDKLKTLPSLTLRVWAVTSKKERYTPLRICFLYQALKVKERSVISHKSTIGKKAFTIAMFSLHISSRFSHNFLE